METLVSCWLITIFYAYLLAFISGVFDVQSLKDETLIYTTRYSVLPLIRFRNVY